MRSKIFVFAALLIVASMVLTACQPAPAEPQTIVQTVIVEGEPVEVVVTATPEAAPEAMKAVTINLGAGDIPTIDPALATDTSSTAVDVETFVGLTRPDEVTNEVQPGMATSWDVSEDGLTYTFYLRENIPWVRYDGEKVVEVTDDDGNVRMVTAYDFEYGILRTLAPATASDYAYVLGMALQGANDYNMGVTDDPTTVGVKAIDATTLELKFLEPAAYNAAIAGMWVAYAQPQWLIEERGDRWTETGFFQGYGPYVMKEWVHDSYLTAVANPFWPGTDEVPVPKIQQITWTMLDESPAFSEFEAGSVDVTTAPLADMDRIKTDPVLSQELRIAPYFCTYFYGFNTKAPVVDDLRVRRALSLALDRQGLIDNVTKAEQIPAQWFSRPGLAGAPTPEEYPDLGVKYDPEAAKATLQEYLDETGQTADQLDITLMFNTNEGHQRIAEAIQQMWKDNLGITVKLVNQEWKVFLDTIKGADTPQIWRSGWCLDYADANNFIREVFMPSGSYNPVDPATGETVGGINWTDEDFSALLLDAAREMDPAKRVELYAQAEEMLVWDEAAIIPIYWYTRATMTKSYVTRTFSSGGQEYIEKWDIDMAAKMGK